MLRRQTTGSVICSSCGVLVGVNDEKCYNCGRRNPGLWGFAKALRALGGDLGFVPLVIGLCAVVYVLTLIASAGAIRMTGLFGLLGPRIETLLLFGASGPLPVFGLGRWWTVLSAAWLHAGALHIILNMYALRQLAPAVSDLYGPGRMVIVYTAGAIAGFVLSSVAGYYLPPLPLIGGGRGITVGASASIAGLIGALWYYGRRGGSSMIRSYASTYVLMMLMQGALIPGIDNYAHIGGLGGGYLAGRLLDPLKPERGDHLMIAVICLALSVLSIVYSVLDGLRFLE